MEWGLRTTEPIFHSYRQSTLGGFTRILFFTFGRTAGCFCLSHCVNFCVFFFVFFYTKPQIEDKGKIFGSLKCHFVGLFNVKKKIIKEVSWLFDTNLKYIRCKFNLHGDSDLLNVKKVSVPILGSDKSKLVEWLIRDIFRERDRKERERKVERERERWYCWW